jgi:hypothetical protein
MSSQQLPHGRYSIFRAAQTPFVDTGGSPVSFSAASSDNDFNAVQCLVSGFNEASEEAAAIDAGGPPASTARGARIWGSKIR